MLSEALRFVAELGRFIIPRLGHPTTTLSHPPSFADGQSHRQTLQLPTPVTTEL